MDNHIVTLEKIACNIAALRKEGVRRILALYEEKIRFIGDFCLRFDKLQYFKSWFNSASVDINFSNCENREVCEAVLANNPSLRSIASEQWDSLAFENYDVIFCAAYDEVRLLQYLHSRYGEAIVGGKWRVCVFSVSELLLPPSEFKKAFPVDEELVKYVSMRRLGEIYISDEEREWANQWLKSKGLKESEQLFILLDSTSRRSKLISIHVYFELLKFLLDRENTRLLIFDEKNIGKEIFYREWLGAAASDRVIFAKGLRLREALRILASSYTRLIFGPCTGLIHCASSIYNRDINRGILESKVPIIIAYTGHYLKNEGNANFWWGRAPLVNCVLIKEIDGRREAVLLSSLPEAEREAYTQIPSSEYTTEMLTPFLAGAFPKSAVFRAGSI